MQKGQALVGVDAGSKIKGGGKEYRLNEVWTSPGRSMIAVQPNGRFIECNDGWFQVYDHFGDKLHLRISPVIVDSIFGK